MAIILEGGLALVSLTVKGLLEVGAAEGTLLGLPVGVTVLRATVGLREGCASWTD